MSLHPLLQHGFIFARVADFLDSGSLVALCATNLRLWRWWTAAVTPRKGALLRQAYASWHDGLARDGRRRQLTLQCPRPAGRPASPVRHVLLANSCVVVLQFDGTLSMFPRPEASAGLPSGSSVLPLVGGWRLSGVTSCGPLSHAQVVHERWLAYCDPTTRGVVVFALPLDSVPHGGGAAGAAAAAAPLPSSSATLVAMPVKHFPLPSLGTPLEYAAEFRCSGQDLVVFTSACTVLQYDFFTTALVAASAVEVEVAPTGHVGGAGASVAAAAAHVAPTRGPSSSASPLTSVSGHKRPRPLPPAAAAAAAPSATVRALAGGSLSADRRVIVGSRCGTVHLYDLNEDDEGLGGSSNGSAGGGAAGRISVATGKRLLVLSATLDVQRRCVVGPGGDAGSVAAPATSSDGTTLRVFGANAAALPPARALGSDTARQLQALQWGSDVYQAHLIPHRSPVSAAAAPSSAGSRLGASWSLVQEERVAMADQLAIVCAGCVEYVDVRAWMQEAKKIPAVSSRTTCSIPMTAGLQAPPVAAQPCIVVPQTVLRLDDAGKCLSVLALETSVSRTASSSASTAPPTSRKRLRQIASTLFGMSSTGTATALAVISPAVYARGMLMVGTVRGEVLCTMAVPHGTTQAAGVVAGGAAAAGAASARA